MIQHIAFIMDGNRRFAKKQQLSKEEGYKSGANQLKKIISFQVKHSIYESSFWALSTENWKMRQEELNALSPALKNLFSTQDKEFEEFCLKHHIALELIGDIEELKTSPLCKEFSHEISELETRVATYNTKISSPKFKVNLLLNYGGQQEIIRATKLLCQKVAEKKLSLEEITPQTFKQELYLATSPPPEIIVRPGDALRLSGFMSWDSAYSELYFTHKMWNELDEEELENILLWFSKQKRNFGK